MNKNIYVHLSNPTSDKYSKFNRACCQNIRQSSWSNHKTELRIDFLNEYDCISIGGDSETEIEIRNSIVQEFGKKNLRTLIEPLKKYYYDELSSLIASEVKENVYKEYGTLNNTLNASTKEQIKDQVAKAIDKEIWSKSMEKINEIAST